MSTVQKLLYFLKSTPKEILLFATFAAFSCLLMWKTFRLDPQGNLLIASKVWSDFAATIPLVRSFSMGDNWPPEYPLFAGEPIRYHYGFYLVVGLIEKSGIPLDWALNIPSSIGLTLLLISIYLSGKIVFKSKTVGILSVLLFAFNGSFAFIEFFKRQHLSQNVLSAIIHSTDFNSFGPYDGKVVSAFWNLNIYTNQRHLALAYATFILICLFFYDRYKRGVSIRTKEALALGIIIGIFPFIHYPVFGMLGIMLGANFLLYPKLRKAIFLIGIISLTLAIPQIKYMGISNRSASFYDPGYLIDDLSLVSFIKYWFLNLGFISIAAPVGFLLASRKQRKFFISFFILFIIGNLFRFSPEIAANHKFFNLFIIGVNALGAYFILYLWNKGVATKFIAAILFFFMTLSGLFDIFPIINDRLIAITDVKNNQVAKYILENTPKNSVFLNSSYLYHPASLAGRKIMMGWPYFPWSAGYDTYSRAEVMRDIYQSTSKSDVCQLLRKNNIDYLTIQDTQNFSDFPIINTSFFQENFPIEYSDGVISIIDVSKSCL